MSTEDKDTARPLYPVEFYGDGEKSFSPKDSPYTDFRARVTPADAEEESVPKAESAPESVESFESTPVSGATPPEPPAQKPAVKDSGQSKVTGPGKPASSPVTTPGKTAPPVKA